MELRPRYIREMVLDFSNHRRQEAITFGKLDGNEICLQDLASAVQIVNLVVREPEGQILSCYVVAPFLPFGYRLFT